MRDKSTLQILFLVATLIVLATFSTRVQGGENDSSEEGEPTAHQEYAGKVISLDDYLSQVREKHDDYRAAKKSYHAGELTAYESHVALSPFLFGSGQLQSDERPNLLFNYQRVETDQYQLGVSQQTSVGLQGRAYYSLVNTAYTGLMFGGPPAQNIAGIQGALTLELTFSIWRNWLGGETNLMVAQGDAANAGDRYSQSFQMKSVLVGAETTFWNLYLSRESVKVSEDAVDRASALFKWHAKRTSLGLSNRSDLLQAEAALQARRLELRSAQDTEVSASRNFNLTRGINSSGVDEQILALTPSQLAALEVPVRKELRDDVKAAAQQVKAVIASSELSREKYLPTLEAYGSASTNSPNPTDYGNVLGNSFNTSRPTASIGLRLNTPLDLGLIHDVRAGWEAKKQAAEFSYQRKFLEQESGWNNLNDRFNQDKVRVALYERLERTQKIKLDYERQRRTQGLTTTQQVILFEQDYQQAQLGRIQTESDLLQVLAQMKLYGDIYGLR